MDLLESRFVAFWIFSISWSGQYSCEISCMSVYRHFVLLDTERITGKKTFIQYFLAFDAPAVWNDLPDDDVISAPHSCLFQKKAKA